MKRCILICGPESSGNRMLCGVFAAAGFHDVTKSTEPHLSGLTTPDDDRPIYLMQSLPHGGQWRPIGWLIETLRKRGYDVHVVVPTRDWHCTASSLVARRHHADYASAMGAVERACRHLLRTLADFRCRYTFVSYESITSRPREVCDWLFSRLGIPRLDELPEFRDENAKHF